MSGEGAIVGSIEFLLLYSLPLAYLSQFVGALANAFANARDLYENSKRPSFAPPGWAFGVAWFILYTLLGFAFWIVRVGDPAVSFSDKDITAATILYANLLFVLAAWSWLFFYIKTLWLSFLWILVCLGLSVATTVFFFFVQPLAGALMIPLCVWVAFASLLNFSIAKNNVVVLKQGSDPRYRSSYMIISRELFSRATRGY